jgi:hypothetical protein
MEEQIFKVPDVVLRATLDYLATKPYKEVHQIIQLITAKSVLVVREEEDESTKRSSSNNKK